MPRYARLHIDVDAEPWQLLSTIQLDQTLGRRAGPVDPAMSIRDLLEIRVEPENIPQPLRLDVQGKRAASMMTFVRGFAPDTSTDLLVSPALSKHLSAFNLPRHLTLECVAVPFSMRAKKEHPFRWMWWKETFTRRIDLARSRFLVRYRDGTRAETQYQDLDDLLQVRKRGASTLDFEIYPLDLEWIEPAIGALDLIPLDLDLFVSHGLAEALTRVKLPAIEVRPPRTLDGLRLA